MSAPMTQADSEYLRELAAELGTKPLGAYAAERLRDIADEIDAGDALRDKLSTLLTGIANGLRGDPPKLCAHSWHDLPELATEMARLFHLRGNSGNAAYDEQADTFARSLLWRRVDDEPEHD